MDNVYLVSFSCVKVKREVEMYQWVEHSDVTEIDEGDEIRHETTYYIETKWSSSLSKSQNFAEELGHKNPRLSLTNIVHNHILYKVLHKKNIFLDLFRFKILNMLQTQYQLMVYNFQVCLLVKLTGLNLFKIFLFLVMMM